MTVREGWKGRCYEDFEVGDIYEHPLGRTITSADNIWFTLLTQNTSPLHFDHNYASQTEFGKPLSVRGIAIGRKNYLFLGSDLGGERAATMYSLIGSAKLNDINPEAYLRHVLSVIADYSVNGWLNYYLGIYS